MHELIIRGGTVVDGTGAPPRVADVAIDDGRISEVGRLGGRATRTIEADGLLVTPRWEADGYVASIKKGAVTFEGGEAGELPGRLLRGSR
jgi:N-acyl-D-aspartate/D-glutamate deacylase